MNVVTFFTAVAVLRCAADDSVTTSLLLPDGLFSRDQPFHKPNFVGQVLVAGNTTSYIVDCYAGGATSYFMPGFPGNDDCTDDSYTFAAKSASTQYFFVG